MSELNGGLVYTCGCNVTMRVQIVHDGGRTLKRPGVYPDLAAILSRMIQSASRHRLRLHMHLLTKNLDDVVLSWKPRSGTVQVSGGKGKTYGNLRLEDGAYDELVRVDAILELLEDANTSLLTVIRFYGDHTKKCALGGHPLDDPTSVHTGYGPVCAKHYDLPWGSPPPPPVLSAQPVRSEGVLIYRCSCGAEIDWRSFAGAAPKAPGKLIYPQLVERLLQMFAASKVDHLRIRLTTMTKANVVLAWSAPSRTVTVNDGGAVTYGSLSLDSGEYVAVRQLEGLFELLAEADVDLVAAARRHAEATGNCSFCGLELSDPRSVAAGYGPICAVHYGLPWGEEEPAVITAAGKLLADVP
jgi:hypothetical protein